MLYFLVALRRPVTRTVQALLLLPLFIVSFHSARNISPASHTIYTTFQRVRPQGVLELDPSLDPAPTIACAVCSASVLSLHVC